MAAKTLEQILGYVYLTGVIQKVKTGIPDNLPPAFQSVMKRVVGDAGRYVQVSGTRATARRTEYGSPSVQRALKGIESKDVKLLFSSEHIVLDPRLLQTLRRYDSYEMQSMGEEEVARQLAEFRALFDNLSLAMKYSMLSVGAIYFDGDGNLLPTSSGAVATISYQMNANNQNQLNGIITASWALANTDIPLQLRNLKLRAAELTGYPLKYAFYGVNIPSYLTQNNYVLDYLSRSPTMREKWLETAEIPDGLFGYTWVPVYTSFYEDQNGTNQTFFDGDKVVFSPEIDSSVYERMEGTYPVPSSLNIAGNPAAALSNFKEISGMHAYGIPMADPPTAKIVTGMVELPIWKNADTLFQADCSP